MGMKDIVGHVRGIWVMDIARGCVLWGVRGGVGYPVDVASLERAWEDLSEPVLDIERHLAPDVPENEVHNLVERVIFWHLAVDADDLVANLGMGTGLKV